MKSVFRIAVPAVLCLLGSLSHLQGASVYTFANWSAFALTPSQSSPGNATGTLATPGGTVSLSYSGDVATATQVNNTGVNYFTGWTSVYTNSVVANLPTSPDIITLSEFYSATPNTLSFSSPVVNPILDIVSLGSPGTQVTYNFSATPTILSQGPAYFGGCSTCLSVSGNSLSGTEGSGVVEFLGTYSSLSWTTAGGEYWNGFNVGVAGVSTVTPEPSTLGLAFVAGLLLLFSVLKMRAQRT